jgi:outer membrane protein TolC
MTQKMFLIILFISLLPAGVEAETLTLSECLGKAATANPDLRVALFDERVAAEGIGIARSGYLPRLNLQGGYTAQQDPQSINLQGRSVQTQQSTYAFTSVALEQTLYDFGRTAARLDRAKALRDASAFSYTALEKDVFLQVVQAYYGILESGKSLQTAEEEVVQMTDHLRVAKNLFEQGVVTRNDLLQAEVQLANSKQQRLMAANRVENGWLHLNYLTGRSSTFRADLQEAALEGSVPAPVDKGFSPEKRAEIKTLQKSIVADEMAVKESRSNYFPELFAKLGADYVENDRVQEQVILYATVGLRINLFDGLATTSRLRQAVQSRSRSEEQLRQVEAGIRLEYDTAVNDARIAAERIRTAEQSVRQGEENLRINKDRYQEHVGTATDVIDAQTLLTRTKTEYNRALFDYEVAVARIKKAKGEL